jgi:probable addiction module antidote protein
MAKTQIFDPAEYLDSPEAIAGYLTEAFATADEEFITKAIGTAARARGMGAVAKQAGVNRENLYRSLNVGGRPEFATVMKVLDALDVQLVAKPKSTGSDDEPDAAAA